ERASVHEEGGLRFIYIPFFFWMWWQEETQIVVRGNDTVVRAPICICDRCQRELREQKRSWSWIVPALLIPAGWGTAFFHLGAGLGLLAAGVLTVLTWIALSRRLAFKAKQKALKNLVSRVPVYRQMLASYPYAVVVVPRAD